MGGRGWALVILLATMVATPAAAAQDAPWVTGESDPENLRLFVVTVGPGQDENFSVFGHSALIVEDRLTGDETMYNYGTRPVNSTETAVKVAFGAADFMLSGNNVDKSFKLYREVDREIRVQRLNLTPEQRLEVAQQVGHDMEPGNRTYSYDYFRDNCSTKLRDILDDVLGGQLRNQTEETVDETYRSTFRSYLTGSLVEDFLVSMMVNAEFDEPLTRWQTMYLPDGLERELEQTEVEGANGTTRSLVAQSFTVYESDHTVPDEPETRWPVTLVLGLVAGGALLALGLAARGRPRVRKALHGTSSLAALLLGAAGLLVLGGWLFTGHGTFAWNENLLVASPIAIAAVPYGIRELWGTPRPRRRLAVWVASAAPALVALPLELFGLLPQNNVMHVAFFAPLAIGAAAGNLLDRRDLVREFLEER